jgi:hypothetical protein
VPVDCSRVNDQLNEVEGLLRELGKGWKADPPRAVFNRKCSEAEGLRSALVKARPEAAADDYLDRLAAFKLDADKAERDQSTASWKDAYNKVCKLCDQIMEAMPPDPNARRGEVLPPTELVVRLGGMLKDLSDHAKQRGVHEKFKGEFQTAAQTLKAINVKAADADNQIRDWYYSQFEELRKKLEAPDAGGLLQFAKK